MSNETPMTDTRSEGTDAMSRDTEQNNPPTQATERNMSTPWKALEKPENVRRYHYPDGGSVEFKNVALIAASASGTHYIETVDFNRYIVPAGWRYIELDMDDWTYPGPSFVARQEFNAKQSARYTLP